MEIRVLKRGDHGKDVIELQKRLGIKVTGFFDVHTELSVKLLQVRHHLRSNGVVTQRVWEVLEGESK